MYNSKQIEFVMPIAYYQFSINNIIKSSRAITLSFDICHNHAPNTHKKDNSSKRQINLVVGLSTLIDFIVVWNEIFCCCCCCGCFCRAREQNTFGNKFLVDNEIMWWSISALHGMQLTGLTKMMVSKTNGIYRGNESIKIVEK